MSRYDNNETQRIRDGRRVYRTRIYPNIPPRDDDEYVRTQDGDRLDLLAYEFYGDQSLWWIIASANNIHNAPIGLEAGLLLRIPQNYIQIKSRFADN